MPMPGDQRLGGVRRYDDAQGFETRLRGEKIAREPAAKPIKI